MVVIIVATFAVIVFLLVSVRKRKELKEECKKCDQELSEFPVYVADPNLESQQEDIPLMECADIEKNLSQAFNLQILSTTQKNKFIAHYTDPYFKVKQLVARLKRYEVDPSASMKKLIADYEGFDRIVQLHNDQVCQQLLEMHKEFFDTCLAYPLDKQQRRSIISEEDNCLVVSSAGSGKTSSIMGKVKYLTEIKKVNPEKILLISYTNKAAAELTERINTPGLRGYTFHKLALDLLAKAGGDKPSICDKTDLIFVDIFRKLIQDEEFQQSVLKYFLDYQVDEADWEKRQRERKEHLSDIKESTIKTIFPDMDGNAIYVRSEQEQKICFVLSSLGIKFRYEESYEHAVSDENHSQYKPDFSIYFEKNGVTQRIYLEHYGVDEHSLVPTWFAEERNISYEEANQKYNDGITWKKEVHEKYGTVLLSTKSADFKYEDIRKKLKDMLEKAGVPIVEKTSQELYNMILPPKSAQEKAFLRLVITFITLVKSSCASIDGVYQKAVANKDERTAFIVQNIFKPVYDGYVEALQNCGQVDFTDIILQATELCRTSRPVDYEYIIVDEFQDISVDRYEFLKQLRNSNPPAKLYCVGDDWQSIYRFSGSDMSLFNQFPEYFGPTEINKIETTYRFGEPLVSLSSLFIQRNKAQITKDIHPFNSEAITDIDFIPYERREYCRSIEKLIATLPADKSIFLLGRYTFDDYYLSFMFKSIKEGNRFFYLINNRKIEFLTVHKSKGLEADYVIILQCNKSAYGFPSEISDDPVLNYVLTKSDQYPFGEERRLFYVAITRAKLKTFVLYDNRFPSVFVQEFLHPENISDDMYKKHRNANKRWTRAADSFLLTLHKEGKSLKYISFKMGRSQTSIKMRLDKLLEEGGDNN